MQEPETKKRNRHLNALVGLCSMAIVIWLAAVLDWRGAPEIRYLPAEPVLTEQQPVTQDRSLPLERPEIISGNVQKSVQSPDDLHIFLTYPIIRNTSCAMPSAVQYAVERKRSTVHIDIYGHTMRSEGRICTKEIIHEERSLHIPLNDANILEEIVITLDGRTNQYTVESNPELPTRIRPTEVNNVYLFGESVEPIKGYESAAEFCKNTDTSACF